MIEKLELPSVTLVMIETREHELARLAVDDCTRAADFGEVVIFSDKFLPFEECAYTRVEKVDDWPTKEGWSQFLWNEAAQHLRTSHMLSIQWDSWIVNPTAWTNDFLRYDYIGAPWWYTDGLNVGNGGFSLRSTALQRFLAKHQHRFPCINATDDDQLCRKYRPTLMQEGFEWAPQAVAERFAFECVPPAPGVQPFGFHAIFNWPEVLPRDRLIERLKIVKQSKYINQTSYMVEQLRKVYPDYDRVG